MSRIIHNSRFDPLVLLVVVVVSGCAALQGNGLISAAGEGDAAEAQAALEKSVDVNRVDKEQRFALLEAASNGHPEVVELLVENGADVDLSNRAGMTALMASASSGHESIVRYLIAQDADVSLKNQRGFTALHFAVDQGDINVIEALVEKGAPVNVSGKKEVPPLFLAVERANKAAAELFIENGAELDAKNPDGNTPLHAAAKKASPELVQLLLDAGAPVSAKNDNGADALLVAAGSNYFTIVENLYKRVADSVDGDFAQYQADVDEDGAGQRYNLYDILQALEGIRPGYSSDTDIKEFHSALANSPLTLVVSEETFQSRIAGLRKDYLETARLLLEAGLPVNTSDRRGETVLMKLCKQKDCVAEEFEKKSIQLAPDVAARLSSACENAGIIHAELMVLFIKKGADVAARDENAQTALMHACENENLQYAKFLIRHGADVNKANYEGWTPLIYAAANEDFEMVKLLLDAGAAVNAANSFGETALLKVAHRNNPEIAELLVKNGADPDIENSHSNSPRSIAREYEYSEILKIFRR